MGDKGMDKAVQRWRGKVRAVGSNTRVGQAALARRDRQVLIDLVVRAGFVDLEWYQAATGRSFPSGERAVADYLHGDGRVPLSPLLAPGRLGDLDRSDASNDAMVRYLQRGNLGYLPNAVFDDAAYINDHPEAAEHPGRARSHFLTTAMADTPLPVPPTWTSPVPTWGPWRAEMIRFAGQLTHREQDRSSTPDPAGEPGYAGFVAEAQRLLDWDRLDAQLPGRIADRVSILIPTINDWRLTDAAVGSLLSNSGNGEIEIVVVDNGSDAAAAIGLAQALIGRDPTLTRIKPVWLPHNLNFALGTNLAFATSTGARIVLLNNDTQVCPGWLEPLLSELNDPATLGVQPLLLYGDGTVQTAGTGFPDCGGLPSHLLVGHPAEDARRLGNFDVSAVTAAALAMRAADYCELRGLDPRFINGFEDVDLCLRALRRAGARFRAATDSTVIHYESRTRTRTVTESNRQILWSTWRDRLPPPDMAEILGAAGFGIVRWDPGLIGRAGLGRIPLPVVVRSPRTTSELRQTDVSKLRWAIKAPVAFTIDVVCESQTSEEASANGDTDRTDNQAADARAQARRVVASVAAALRELGQEVVIDCREAHQRATSGLDDVVLVLAEQEQFEPQPGRANLLWFWDTAAAGGGAVAEAGGRGWHDGYDRFGFSFVLERPATDLTTSAAWLALAEDFLVAVARRSGHPA